MQNTKGTLNLILGPMFSGKTTQLNTELTKFADLGASCLKIVHSLDTRNDVPSNDYCGSTHNSSYTQLTKKIKVVRTDNLANVDINGYQVISIDEAQFFTNLYNIIYDWVENKGLKVWVASLSGDYKKEKFGEVCNLIPLADNILKLNAICVYCFKKSGKLNCNASFTKRITSNMDQQLIGGSDSYVATCRKHHC